ncbi:hypothetical protein FACS189425_09500 [Clostridia bacterium]|nr:hypothetical protein FACS189425_09500 [Clostridia bacterium]
MYKRITATLIFSAVLFSSATAISPSTSIESFWQEDKPKHFTDLQHYEWAANSIATLSKWGIIAGYNDELFKPSEYMTRSEFAKIVVSSFGAYDENAEVERYDNPRNEWYYHYVGSVIQTGIASGYSDEFFGAHDNILRQDIAVMVKRAMDFADFDMPVVNVKIQYADADEIQDYAKDAVEYLSRRGAFKGDEFGKFNPMEKAERAEIAVLFERVLTMGEPK